MSSRLIIPQGARVEISTEGEIPSGPNAGGMYHIRLWAGFASHGWKTDYQPVPHRWLEIRYQEGPERKWKRLAWSYSGSRLEKGLADYRSNLDALAKAAQEVSHA